MFLLHKLTLMELLPAQPDHTVLAQEAETQCFNCCYINIQQKVNGGILTLKTRL